MSFYFSSFSIEHFFLECKRYQKDDYSFYFQLKKSLYLKKILVNP